MLRVFGILLFPALCFGAVNIIAALPKSHITAATRDAAGAIYVTGYIQSPDLPATPGAFQTQYHYGDCGSWQFSSPCPDGFVAKFDSSGRLLFATYLGGSGFDWPEAIAVDTAGSVYVAGGTLSSDFPLSANRIGDTGSAFAAKLDAKGAYLLYSTKLPGVADVRSIALGGADQLIMAGIATAPGLTVTPGAIQTEFHGTAGYPDGVVLKLGVNGDRLLFATYLGGSRSDSITSLALDTDGNVYLAGTTSSRDFPYTAGALDTRPTVKQSYSDAFVAKLNPTGTELIYVARPSGSCNDQPNAIVVDRNGRAILTGSTCSSDYPLTAGAVQSEMGLISSMAFATVLSADGKSIEYSTYLGGSQYSSGLSILLDDQQRIVVSGQTGDPDFPATADAPSRCSASVPTLSTGFLTRIDLVHPEDRFATYLDVEGAVLPTPRGQMIVAGGDGRIATVDAQQPSGLSLECVANAASGYSAAVAARELVTIYGSGLVGADVLFDELLAEIVMAASDRVTAVVPAELAGRTIAQVRMRRGQLQSDPVAVTVASAAPGVFRLDSSNRAAVLNEDGTINSAANPAKRGSVIAFWATGIGPGPVKVSFFGWDSEVLYAGSAPSMSDGVEQINVRVPTQMGPFLYPVDLVVSSGGVYMPVRVTVNVQ